MIFEKLDWTAEVRGSLTAKPLKAVNLEPEVRWAKWRRESNTCHQVAGLYAVCCEGRNLQGVHQARLSKSEVVCLTVVKTVESDYLGSHPSSLSVPSAHCSAVTTLKTILYNCYLSCFEASIRASFEVSQAVTGTGVISVAS